MYYSSLCIIPFYILFLFMYYSFLFLQKQKMRQKIGPKIGINAYKKKFTRALLKSKTFYQTTINMFLVITFTDYVTLINGYLSYLQLSVFITLIVIITQLAPDSCKVGVEL